MFHCLPLPRGVGTARPHFPHPPTRSSRKPIPVIPIKPQSRQKPQQSRLIVLHQGKCQISGARPSSGSATTKPPNRIAMPKFSALPPPRNPRPGSRDPFPSRPIKANRALSRQTPFFETTCMLANQTTGLDGPSDEYRNVCQEEILSWGERTKVRASVPQNCLAASPHPPIKAKNPVIVHNQGISRQPVKILNPTFRPRHPNVPAPGSSMLDVLAKKPAPHQSVSR